MTLKKMGQGSTHYEILSLLSCASGEKKCAVFAQFWEAMGSSTSHLFIENQHVKPRVGRKEKSRICAAYQHPHLKRDAVNPITIVTNTKRLFATFGPE
ncbi:MAG: hypothetical protein IAE95_01630 [Chitinophagaceae bacterium]|nr:hypothetical protein [Chitinophagaceae bacterium]